MAAHENVPGHCFRFLQPEILTPFGSFPHSQFPEKTALPRLSELPHWRVWLSRGTFHVGDKAWIYSVILWPELLYFQLPWFCTGICCQHSRPSQSSQAKLIAPMENFFPFLLLQTGHKTPADLREPFSVTSGGGRSGGFDPGKENQNAGSQRGMARLKGQGTGWNYPKDVCERTDLSVNITLDLSS